MGRSSAGGKSEGVLNNLAIDLILIEIIGPPCHQHGAPFEQITDIRQGAADDAARVLGAGRKHDGVFCGVDPARAGSRRQKWCCLRTKRPLSSFASATERTPAADCP
jgi:hypothetical protein